MENEGEHFRISGRMTSKRKNSFTKLEKGEAGLEGGQKDVSFISVCKRVLRSQQ